MPQKKDEEERVKKRERRTLYVLVSEREKGRERQQIRRRFPMERVDFLECQISKFNVMDVKISHGEQLFLYNLIPSLNHQSKFLPLHPFI